VRDPEVMRYMGCGLRYTAKRAITSLIALVSDVEPRWKIRHLARHWQRHGFGEWAVEEKATGQLIGQIGLTLHLDWSADPAKVEIGWLLARHAWGRGFATEGARVSLAYAFEQLKLQRIISITKLVNVRSLRVMQRIGLATVGKTYWKGCSVVWSALDRVTWEHNLAQARVDVKGLADLREPSGRKA
jgi:RimJ/RimL family protein N-acetyltransferase